MDFELSDDQLGLRAAARDLLERFASRERVRAVVDAGGGMDAELWKAMADQGWMGVELDPSAGGLGLGPVESAVLLEELGRRLAPAPLLPTLLAVGALARAGLDDWVGRLVAGDAVACVAWSESAPVVYAPSADVAVVVRDDEVVVAELPAGRRPRREPAMDLTRELGWLELDGVECRGIGGEEVAAELMDRAAAGLSAEMLGGASRVLEMTVDHARDRVQFGRPIGSFQAVKHRCADMVVDVEGMRSSAYYAAWCIAAAHREASLAASSAKVWCSDAARRVMASGLQVHGGIGFTWEHDLHLYLKRSQLDQVSWGDASFHRDRVARLLRPRVEAGESIV